MKKFIITCLIVFSTVNIFGGPPHHNPGHRGDNRHIPNINHYHNPRYYPGPNYHHYHYHNSGICLATDIVNLVGASINLLTPTTVVVEPTTVSPVYPVVTTPIQPVYPIRPIYYPPAPRAVYPTYYNPVVVYTPKYGPYYIRR